MTSGFPGNAIKVNYRYIRKFTFPKKRTQCRRLETKVQS